MGAMGLVQVLDMILAPVQDMILALVLVIVDQEDCMEVGQAIVAVVVIIPMPGRCLLKLFPVGVFSSWFLHLMDQSRLDIESDSKKTILRRSDEL